MSRDSRTVWAAPISVSSLMPEERPSNLPFLLLYLQGDFADLAQSPPPTHYFVSSPCAPQLLIRSPSPPVQGDFANLAQSMGGQGAAFCFAFDEPLSHLIYAACDFILVPSMFEPCGLTQVSHGVSHGFMGSVSTRTLLAFVHAAAQVGVVGVAVQCAGGYDSLTDQWYCTVLRR